MMLANGAAAGHQKMGGWGGGRTHTCDGWGRLGELRPEPPQLSLVVLDSLAQVVNGGELAGPVAVAELNPPEI